MIYQRKMKTQNSPTGVAAHLVMAAICGFIGSDAILLPPNAAALLYKLNDEVPHPAVAEPRGAALCWQIPFIDRVDCHPETNATEDRCLQRGCCWIPYSTTERTIDFSVGSRPTLQAAPVCFFPTHYNRTYYITSVNNSVADNVPQISAMLQLPQPTQFSSPDISTLALTATYQTSERLRLTLNDASPNSSRWQTPYPPLQPITTKSYAVNRDQLYTYSMSYNGSLFGFRVSRAVDDNAVVLFDATSVGAPLIYTDQLLMLSARLPGVHAVYGLGEHWGALNRLGGRYTFFPTDAPPIPNGRPGYGSIPFFIALGPGGEAFGAYLHNSNAMEIEITADGIITYRVTGGILDFYFFLGPKPEDVVRQFTELVGRPQMPAYWTLGFHLCRYGYGSSNETSRIFHRNIDVGIPVQTQWNDIDYMLVEQDFTYDPVAYAGLGDFVRWLHDTGRNWVPITDVGIPNFLPPGSYPPYDEGTVDNVWVKSPNSDAPLVGKVWPGETVYPDFTHPNATEWWTRQVLRFHEQIPFDGMWIDMNEPSNFYDGSTVGCPSRENGNTLDYPPYQPASLQNKLFSHTICMAARHYLSVHYNLHNVYAYTEAKATHAALLEVGDNKTRPFIVTRANFAGIGAVSAHWSGDIRSTWYDLQRSIAHMLNYNMYGVPMVGSDICGFGGNTTEELCLRWHQLGAFYPFSRNHNSIENVDQDPAAWSTATQAAIRSALVTRYQLLPHFYTMLAYASILHGGTAIRPLSFEFPHDFTTYEIDWQFFIGESVMIIPVLEEGARSVIAYFPQSKENRGDLWYDFYTGELIASSDATAGVYKELSAPLDTINVVIRGGNIIPLQHEAMTLTESRLKKFFLYAALDDGSRSGVRDASGSLYWDSGNDYNVLQNGQFNLIHFSAGVRPRTVPVSTEPTHSWLLEILMDNVVDAIADTIDSEWTADQCTYPTAVGWFFVSPEKYLYKQEPMTLDTIRFSGVRNESQPTVANGVWVENLMTKTVAVRIKDWSYDSARETLLISLDGLITFSEYWAIYWC